MNFLCVHGSFHGAWCWEHLTPLLEARGHRVLAPDLPGSGADSSPLENASLESYATRIAAALDTLPGAVVLVGHSMGGIVASQVAERRARRLHALVYLNGLLLRSGETLIDFIDAHQHLGVEDLVLKNMWVSADGAYAMFPRERAVEVFYNTCRADDAAAAAARLRVQAMQVYRDALRLTPEGYGSVRRFYVEGLQDRAVSLAYQRAMSARTPCERIFSLDCDHSPFLSARAELADILDEIAQSSGR